MDEATLTQLLNSAGTGSGTSLLDVNSIVQALAPFILALTVVSILITVLYVASVIGKWRANKAVVDIKKLLIEMNERDKMRDGASPTRIAPPEPVPATAPQDTARS